MDTTADEQLEVARDSLTDAIRSLSLVVVDKIWGSEDYTIEYRAMLYVVLKDLLTLKEKLDG